jgi:hypothetical protein
VPGLRWQRRRDGILLVRQVSSYPDPPSSSHRPRPSPKPLRAYNGGSEAYEDALTADKTCLRQPGCPLRVQGFAMESRPSGRPGGASPRKVVDSHTSNQKEESKSVMPIYRQEEPGSVLRSRSHTAPASSRGSYLPLSTHRLAYALCMSAWTREFRNTG